MLTYKRRAVAAQTARRYFAIFAAFKESMTLNLAHRSFHGHTFWRQSGA